MRIALGLRGKNLTRENIAFAAQLGCTDIVATLFAFEPLPSDCAPYLRMETERYVVNQADLFSVEHLSSIRTEAARHGLTFETIENFSPTDYYDIMLGGPLAQKQLGYLKTIIRNAAKAGIKQIGFGYNPPGVWGRKTINDFRGGASGLVFDGDKLDLSKPIPNGVIWNTIYDPYAPEGSIGTINKDMMLKRYRHMMEELLPVAADVNINLCLHPSNPPLPTLRGIARLGSSPSDYDELFTTLPQPQHKMIFCVGTIQEMAETKDITKTLTHFLQKDRVGYIHMRNVSGKVPRYREEFPDEGDIDMRHLAEVLIGHRWNGILLPDHTPTMTVVQPWHTGMALAVGYLKGLFA